MSTLNGSQGFVRPSDSGLCPTWRRKLGSTRVLRVPECGKAEPHGSRLQMAKLGVGVNRMWV